MSFNQSKITWSDRHKQLERELQRLRDDMEAQEALQLEKRELIQQVGGWEM